MLEGIAFSLVGLSLKVLGQPANLETIQLSNWQNAAVFTLPPEPDPATDKILQQYLKDLSAKGLPAENQGIWIQSGLTKLATHQGTVPISAASITKIATTLASLEKWSPEHRFETGIYGTGEIKNGVLQGDLIVSGSGDPLFVWEEAIALGNALNKMGIRKVTGNLIVTPDFYMNYESKPQIAAQQLRQGLNSATWNRGIIIQHALMPKETPRPQVAIAGSIKVQENFPENAKLLLRHQSMDLTQILKQMNVYSNNHMAQMLADLLGGAKIVSQLAAQAADVPENEIQLINGSGLGVENRISPRASVAMLIAIDNKLKSQPIQVTDLFPVAGRDKKGTMVARKIPNGTAVKTGTLNAVSALVGVMPTGDRGQIWFAILNQGGSLLEFRAQQDQLLQSLAQEWKVVPLTQTAVTSKPEFFGDPSRNLISQEE
ncbi:D-alanyl-D-alanine carboxypeptidase [Oscillatoria salina]|uniref:D-alanyl-D-alanine carboxypeptidase n=1 Tax=Oscillatoria salina TaxID=331517 RepID=UPI0013B72539|nr:D-alanyl-D-alanine carboxypeptidase [Oscillatoria salina]MBZ8182906.1 D-alanyl-D-alanine carboxypeptidase [Oscillatoria salina IIICB1]NET86587.1 D-alanyl-D-alanine carboxypeptidase [Kamptonema sp. SIO1D9]